MSVQNDIELFAERLASCKLANEADLIGCNEADLDLLERTYDVTLPKSYRLFLEKMGLERGRFATGLKLSFDDALRMTQEQQQVWSTWPPFRRPPFPSKGLIVCMRVGLPEYWLIVCDRRDDSPVYRFDYECEPVRFINTHSSFLNFLEMLLAEAMLALAPD